MRSASHELQKSTVDVARACGHWRAAQARSLARLVRPSVVSRKTLIAPGIKSEMSARYYTKLTQRGNIRREYSYNFCCSLHARERATTRSCRRTVGNNLHTEIATTRTTRGARGVPSRVCVASPRLVSSHFVVIPIAYCARARSRATPFSSSSLTSIMKQTRLARRYLASQRRRQRRRWWPPTLRGEDGVGTCLWQLVDCGESPVAI